MQAEAPSLDRLMAAIHACRVCREAPEKTPLPHAPQPILQVSGTARIVICSQAPGNIAHQKGVPFYDPSGVRLRDWLGLDEATFYDASRIAIIPMGFCFPGYDRHGGDLPPRPECVTHWHDRLFSILPELRLFLVIGKYSIAYHLPERRRESLWAVVRDWRAIAAATAPRPLIVLPHPSWRNNVWIRRNPFFEAELVPALRRHVARVLGEVGEG